MCRQIPGQFDQGFFLFKNVVYNVFYVHKLYYQEKGAWYDDKKWKNVYTAFYFVDIPVLWYFMGRRGRGAGTGFPGGGADGGFHWKNLI